MHLRSFIVLSVATSSMVQASTFWKAGAVQNGIARLTGKRASPDIIYSEEVEAYLKRVESARGIKPSDESSIDEPAAFWKAGVVQNGLARYRGVRASPDIIYSEEVEEYLRQKEAEQKQLEEEQKKKEEEQKKVETERKQAPQPEAPGILRRLSNYFTRSSSNKEEILPAKKEEPTRSSSTKEVALPAKKKELTRSSSAKEAVLPAKKPVADKVLKMPEFELYTKMCKEQGGAISRFGDRFGKRGLTKAQKLLEYQRTLAEDEAAELGVDVDRLNSLLFARKDEKDVGVKTGKANKKTQKRKRSDSSSDSEDKKPSKKQKTEDSDDE